MNRSNEQCVADLAVGHSVGLQAAGGGVYSRLRCDLGRVGPCLFLTVRSLFGAAAAVMALIGLGVTSLP